MKDELSNDSLAMLNDDPLPFNTPNTHFRLVADVFLQRKSITFISIHFTVTGKIDGLVYNNNNSKINIDNNIYYSYVLQ